MVVDTSVLLHIALAESGWDESTALLVSLPDCVVAAPSLVEASAVLNGRTEGDPKRLLRTLLDELGLKVVPFTEVQARLAQDAYARFGKGRGHPAELNFGDVLSYALARDRKDRLAFVGDDFQHTDLDVLRLPLSGSA